MVCQPHQYILVKMASYVPQGYNTQSLYNLPQQRGLVYTAPRVTDYIALSGYNSQKNYVGVEQDNQLQRYRGKNAANYGESGYLFSKTPEVINGAGSDFFKTRRLNDLVGEDVVESVFTVPQPDTKNPIQRGYQVGILYKPQRKEKQKKVEEVNEREIGRMVEDKNMDTKRLAELIEQELKQFKTEIQQVHYV